MKKTLISCLMLVFDPNWEDSVDIEILGPKTAPAKDSTNQLTPVKLSASPAAGAAPLTVTLTATASDPEKLPPVISRRSDSGTPNVGEPVTLTYEQPGTYTAHVTAIDDAGNRSAASAQVVVRPPNEPSSEGINSDKLDGQNSLFITLIGDAHDTEGRPVQARWRFPDGSVVTGTSAAQTTPVNGRIKGHHHVTLQIVDTTAPDELADVTITVDEKKK